jgi:hypothetical protein
MFAIPIESYQLLRMTHDHLSSSTLITLLPVVVRRVQPLVQHLIDRLGRDRFDEKVVHSYIETSFLGIVCRIGGKRDDDDVRLFHLGSNVLSRVIPIA